MKEVLHNLAGKLRLPWKTLKCENVLPSAVAATEIYSGAYDAEVTTFCYEPWNSFH